jgi:hypothetical protein
VAGSTGLVRFDVILLDGRTICVEIEATRPADEIAKVIARKTALPVPPEYKAELYNMNTGQALLRNTADEINHVFAAGSKIALRIVPSFSSRLTSMRVSLPTEDQVVPPVRDYGVASPEAMRNVQSSQKDKGPPSVIKVVIICATGFALGSIVGGLCCVSCRSLGESRGIGVLALIFYATAGPATTVILGLGLFRLAMGFSWKHAVLLWVWGALWPLLYIACSVPLGCYVFYSRGHYLFYSPILLLGSGVILGLLFKDVCNTFTWKHFALASLGWLCIAILSALCLETEPAFAFDGLIFWLPYGSLLSIGRCVIIDAAYGAVGGLASGLALRSALRSSHLR